MHPVDPVLVTGYVALFVAIGGAFLAVNLLVGWLVRPRAPNVEKLEVYECGEPTIGSSFVQFDLRFYVVALLFIIFDVEVALFFPWATVFGKATQLDDPALASVQADGTLTPAAAGLFRELGVRQPTVPAAGAFRNLIGVRGASAAATADAAATTHDEAWHATRATAWAQARARSVGRAEPQGAQAVGEWSVATTGALLARTALVDMAAFFAVLLVGFAYVWYRGDLDWVRAVSTERAAPVR